MSREVHVYTIGGGGSIDWVPGVVPAAWGGPRRAWRAVRAAPKTRNYETTRVLTRATGAPAHDRTTRTDISSLIVAKPALLGDSKPTWEIAYA